MKRIKFHARTIFETHGPNHPDNPVFEAEQPYDMSDDQASRWFRRGVAELVQDLGSDDASPTVAGVSKEKVREVEAAVEQRDEKFAGKMTETLNKGSSKLKDAMKEP